MKGEQYTTDLQDRLQARILSQRGKPCTHEVAPAVVKEESQPVPQPPEDKVERDTMPETDKQHGRDLPDQDHPPCGDAFIPAHPAVERIEKVGAEPLC